MGKIIEVRDLSASGLDIYRDLTDGQLRSRELFVAESPKVIRMALLHGYEPVSLLCERRHICGDAADIVERCDGIPLYTGEREVLASITGYTLTRGVLCAMKRPALPAVADVCRGASRVAVLHDVCDTTNIGSIFRSAAALGVDAVLLSPRACDPLNRRSVRVSMGTVFAVPWTRVAYLDELSALGFRLAALALEDRSVSLDDPALGAEPRLALIFGTEGDGLPADVIRRSDYVVKIPMSRGVDSLNVGAAAAVAFWHLRPQSPSVPEVP